jgi:hypothetical protein
MNLLDRLLGKDDGVKAIAAYNAGLEAKYAADWKRSLAQNQQANRLSPGDEATLWNLAIAATALRDWDEARRAWTACGIQVNDGPGEVLMPPVSGCVRLDPNGVAEVVWGKRIDPARMLVENVPLPESGRRYGDIILHDGAPEGQRIKDGQEYPVFDELSVWYASANSTFEVELTVPNQTAFDDLTQRCWDGQLSVEDWGQLRALCEACSRGTPAEHDCDAHLHHVARYGFASKSEAELRKVLADWCSVTDGAAFANIALLLDARSQ